MPDPDVPFDPQAPPDPQATLEPPGSPGARSPAELPTDLTPEQQELHRQGMIAAGREASRQQPARRREVRLEMMRSIITEPLLSKVRSEDNRHKKFDVIISLNEKFTGGIAAALEEIRKRAEQWKVRYATVSHYCFACLTGEQILDIAKEARDLARENGPNGSVVYRIWEDSDISVTLTRSLTTVKADAAQRAFQARGEGIVWAVLDSGVEGTHEHFSAQDSPFGPFATLDIEPPVRHLDFTPDGRDNPPPVDARLPIADASATVDRFGHGTHVAGIIAGYWHSQDPNGDLVAGTELRDEETNEPVLQVAPLRVISGVAPQCKLVSLKVIADVSRADTVRQTAGQGKVSWVIMAIDQIQQWNQHGRRILIHGVNMSLGYDFDPRWFACGQSPLCVEVNRLVRSGVCVVVSAGNSGYSYLVLADGQEQAQFSDLSITDPGNAELAITVGSTHREMPHTYGVSYFSSRGPTGDGRLKPDLIAPGEHILSCAAGAEAAKFGTVVSNSPGPPARVLYCELSGTSMAAPHVSGAIAAFLSVRGEFIGQPERVKEIFLANTVDLKRDRCFQGTGLLDLMRVLQAV